MPSNLDSQHVLAILWVRGIAVLSPGKHLIAQSRELHRKRLSECYLHAGTAGLDAVAKDAAISSPARTLLASFWFCPRRAEQRASS